MKTVTKWLVAASGAAAILVFFACNKSNSSNSNPNIPKGQSQVSLYMTDGPMSFAKVLIDIRQVAAQAALKPYVSGEYEPGPTVASDAEIDALIAASGETIYHPVGTCRMGVAGDPMAVVDDELRVMGLKGLRVVDASVMPTLIGGNTNAPTIMIAEKAADLILGRPVLAAEEVPVAGDGGRAAA